MGSTTIGEAPVRMNIGRVALEGNLSLPDAAQGVVLFAHGSGSGRHSPRNRFVAQELQAAGLATLLLDLLTREEEEIDNVTRQLRFDIDLLAERVVAAIDWAGGESNLRSLKVGLFGA